MAVDRISGVLYTMGRVGIFARDSTPEGINEGVISCPEQSNMPFRFINKIEEFAPKLPP